MYTMYLVSVFKENGKISLNNSENCEILTEYFYKLLNCSEKIETEFLYIVENLEDDFNL